MSAFEGTPPPPPQCGRPKWKPRNGSYPFNLTEDPQEVEAGELLEVVERPRPRGQEAGKQRRVLGHVLQARRGSGRGESLVSYACIFVSTSIVSRIMVWQMFSSGREGTNKIQWHRHRDMRQRQAQRLIGMTFAKMI